jgi:hypothetical protein
MLEVSLDPECLKPLCATPSIVGAATPQREEALPTGATLVPEPYEEVTKTAPAMSRFATAGPAVPACMNFLLCKSTQGLLVEAIALPLFWLDVAAPSGLLP